ncbi:11450_t:CDS:2 [Scutellospora calospora]|uniref:11450_t:CDS:1 n=1 Tax=Scutellospora calospora TaxID=85575 RepID=A0ACA9MCK1_9GLOM|nr:11450_t:CDS:2 [Scutellospora calospora]
MTKKSNSTISSNSATGNSKALSLWDVDGGSDSSEDGESDSSEDDVTDTDNDDKC